MSIHTKKLADGSSRYVVRWRDERRRNCSRAFASPAQAREFEALRTVMSAQRQRSGQFAPVEPAQMTFNQWSSRWWEEVVKHQTQRSTRIGWASLLNKWITPYLGNVPLPMLGRPAILEWRSEIMSRGATPTVANRALGCLSACLGQAVERNLLPYNPARGIKRMEENASERPALSPRTVEAIRDQLEPRDALLVSLMAYCGLRPGEAFALRSSSIQQRTLRVTHSFVREQIKSPKTGVSRVVDVPPSVMAELEAYGVRDMDPEDFIFGASRGAAMPISPGNWRSRVWTPALAKLGMSVHVYALRHSFASLLIYSGASLPVVSYQLGHSNPAITAKVYVHMFRDVEMGSEVRSIEDAIQGARKIKEVV